MRQALRLLVYEGDLVISLNMNLIHHPHCRERGVAHGGTRRQKDARRKRVEELIGVACSR